MLKDVGMMYENIHIAIETRVTTVWNSLPDYVVCAWSIDSFKNCLDKSWEHEDVVYNYLANLSASIFWFVLQYLFISSIVVHLCYSCVY
jgi:hypothetical protein